MACELYLLFIFERGLRAGSIETPLNTAITRENQKTRWWSESWVLEIGSMEALHLVNVKS